MSRTGRNHKTNAPKNLNFAVVICSSSRHQKLNTGKNVIDQSGDLIVETLRQHGHSVTYRTLIPDDQKLIKQCIKKALSSSAVDVVVTCGGTGISPTDVTIEGVQPLLEKEINGFGEVFRALSYKQIGSAVILSRALAGVSHGKALFCMPGSPKAVSLCLEEIILPEVGHIIKHARGK
ncbi:MAG: MogA/MoaB family molybdenum cofactor biosynthesis protein [Candidatus Bathyarchaeota archaeon]|nr:MAG: MogA/MoaB family molybdenum cofactor biosynthesis protein [Candidatus Bathyarchaeota archaeon]